MCRQETDKGAAHALRTIAAIAALGAVLAGCSDIYYERRDTIASAGGDWLAANAVTQMIDPWPPHSGDTRLTYNGQRAAAAIERYRNDKVTPPVNPTTSDVQNQQQSAAQAATQASSSSSSSGATSPPPPNGSSSQ